MRAVLLKAFGGPEQMYIGDTLRPVPKAGELLIRVHCFGLNRADCLQRKGDYAPPPGASAIMGLEAAGEIAEIGSDVKGKWVVGDRVMALAAGGAYAEYVAIPEVTVMPIPTGFSYVQAAAIPEAFLTAFQLLHTIGSVEKGDHVLVHAGASGVGTTAIQLCKVIGAHAIVTAGTREKIEFCTKLGALAGFNYKEGPFAGPVLKLLGERKASGVNIVLDCVGASQFEQNLEMIALDGRWVLYGTMGGGEVPKVSLSKLHMKRVILQGTTLRSRTLAYQEKLVKAMSAHTLPLFAKGSLAPIIDKVMPFAEIVQGHVRMEADRNLGKIVIQIIEPAQHQQ